MKNWTGRTVWNRDEKSGQAKVNGIGMRKVDRQNWME